jgi:hypothetical protein
MSRRTTAHRLTRVPTPRAFRRTVAAVTMAVPLMGLAHATASPTAQPRHAQPLFAYQDPRITESSGLAVSARHDSVVYTHNDSGDRPVLYAVGPDGGTRAVLTLRGTSARDWEALAPGRDGTLWVGDIGDNRGSWNEIRVYKVDEPRVLRSADVGWTRYRLRYEDGARNAEALLVDPRTGRLYVVSKQDKGASIYAAPLQLRSDGVNVLRRVAGAPAEVTDGAFLPDGSRLVLRGYFSAVVLDRSWRTVTSLTVPLQPQGESLAATRDGTAVLVGSEGRSSQVWRVPLPEAPTFGSPVAVPAASPPAASPAAPTQRAQRLNHATTVVGVLAGVSLLLLGGRLVGRRGRGFRAR